MSRPNQGGRAQPDSRDELTNEVRPARAALDVAVQVVGRLLNLALGVVATAVLARGLGRYGFGQWSTILLVPALLAYLNNLGLFQVAVRRASSENDARWLGALVSARAALSIPVTLVTLLALVFVAHGSAMFVAGAIIALQGLLAAPEALASVFQVRIRNDLAMIALTVNSLLWTGGVIVISASHGGLVPYAVAMSAIAVVSVALQAAIALRTVRIPIHGTHLLWRRLAREAVPLSIGSLLIVAYARIDALIVYASAGTTAAGLYNAAYRIVEQLGVVPLSLVATLMPLVSRIAASKPAQTRRTLQLGLDLMAMFSLAAVAFAIVAAHPIIELLYGASFDASAPALAVLMGSFAFVCCGYIFAVYTLVLDLQRQFARFAFIGLAFNLLVNLLLVPRYGFMAAAWATLATELLVAGLTGRMVFAHLDVRPSLGRLLRSAIAACISGAAAYALLQAGLPVLLLLLVAALVHVGSLLALGALDVGEIKQLLRGEPIAAG